tara:strand:+ start:249 stop:383 length:135 start_codon:yes stop_codon:yes gene_type:complete
MSERAEKLLEELMNLESDYQKLIAIERALNTEVLIHMNGEADED